MTVERWVEIYISSGIILCICTQPMRGGVTLPVLIRILKHWFVKKHVKSYWSWRKVCGLEPKDQLFEDKHMFTCIVKKKMLMRMATQGTRAPSQYPKRRLSVRSRKVSKWRDLYLELSDRSEIWQALRQQCCRCACQISKRYDNLKYQSRGFDTLRDLTKRRLFGYWDGALSIISHGTDSRVFLDNWLI